MDSASFLNGFHSNFGEWLVLKNLGWDYFFSKLKGVHFLEED